MRESTMMMRTRRVPSWAVAAAGGLIVTVSVALGPLRLHGLEDAIRNERAGLNELAESNRQHWGTHVLAENLGSSADLMIGFGSQSALVPRSFRLERAGWHLLNAIIAMSSGTGVMDDSELGPDLDGLVERLVAGDLDAYLEMSSLFDRFRLESAALFEAKGNGIVAVESRLAELERRRDRIRRWQDSMNVVGLVIVLLAGLPIWRRR